MLPLYRLALLFLLPCLPSCVSEMKKFPGQVQQQWAETSMIDDTLLEVSGKLQPVVISPQSLGCERLRLYEKVSSQVRTVTAAAGTPDFIRETNQMFRAPILELFYLERNQMYRFPGQKGLSVYGDPPPGPQPIPASAEGNIERMRSLNTLQKTVQ